MKPLQPQRLWRYLVVAALLAAFGTIAWSALTAGGEYVRDVVVEIRPTPDGLFLIEAGDVRDRLDAGPHGVLAGQPVGSIAFERLEAFLREDPFVADAELYTGYDGVLRVVVEQKQPVMRVHDRRGADYYVGPGGEILPLSKHDVARVPVLTGEVTPFAEAAADSFALDAFALARAIADDALLAPLIEQVDRRGGEYVLVPKLGTAHFTVGRLEDLDDKLYRLRAFLLGALPEVGWEHYESLDLRYDGQVVAKRRGGVGA